MEPTKYPNYDNALQAILSAKSSPPAAPPEPTYEKVCNKQLDDVRNDKSKWKWTQRDPVVAKIEEFCSQSFTGDSAEQEYEEGYENHDGFKLVARYKGINPPDKNTCIHNLRDHLVDGCDGDGRLNQYNVKWGGRRTEKPSGLEFEVIPTQTRVSTDSPNWECNTWANREQKGFKGKDGKDLPSDIDDAMMKHQCVHQLWNMGWQTKGIDCGGSYNIVLTGSVSSSKTKSVFPSTNSALEWLPEPHRLLEVQLPLHCRLYRRSNRCHYDRNSLGWQRGSHQELPWYQVLDWIRQLLEIRIRISPKKFWVRILQ